MWFKKTLRQQQFSQWITSCHKALFQHALWMTGNQDLARDMVQETYFQGWLALESLQDIDKVMPWLLTILRRVIYREQRYQYRHRETLAHMAQWEEPSVVNCEYSLVVIYRAMESLSYLHREAFLLYELHGFSYAEISDQLAIPIGTVMSRIARAKAALKSFNQTDFTKVVPLDLNRGEA